MSINPGVFLLKKTILIGLLLCCMYQNVTGQKDSIQIILNSTGKNNPELWRNALHKIFDLSKSQDNQGLMDFFKKSLEHAAKADIPPALLDEMLFNFSEQAKAKQLEQDFTLMLLKLENNPGFSNPALQIQLQYYYASYFYLLKEYYYAEKYCNLYLINQHKYPLAEDHNKQFLNMMTVSALIDQEQNKIDQAIIKFKTTLDSAISKKEDAWVGITSGNLAYCLFLGGKYEEAIPLLEKDIQVSKETFQLGSAINSEITLAEIFHSQKNNPKAFEYIDSAKRHLDLLTIDNPNNFNIYMSERFKTARILGMLYHQKDDLINANNFLAKSIELDDSLKQFSKAGLFKTIL